MNVNADFSRRAVVHTEQLDWEASPMPGVERRRLDRVDDKHDRVTTVVRYAPGSSFSSHIHDGGEEFLVLDGVFEDDYGEWPEGSYIRNPPYSEHTPGSQDGCVIFVKLWQFDPQDRTFVHANIHKLGRIREQDRAGVEVSPLFKDAREYVRMEYWDANSLVRVDASGGAELFVVSGSFEEQGEQFDKRSWLRLPIASSAECRAGAKGAGVWIKSGHLQSEFGT